MRYQLISINYKPNSIFQLSLRNYLNLLTKIQWHKYIFCQQCMLKPKTFFPSYHFPTHFRMNIKLNKKKEPRRATQTNGRAQLNRMRKLKKNSINNSAKAYTGMLQMTTTMQKLPCNGSWSTFCGRWPGSGTTGRLFSPARSWLEWTGSTTGRFSHA